MKINSADGIKYDFKVGADPEIFVSKSGKYVSAYGLIPGTKKRPYPVKNGAVQVDGMALEFNINPADNFEQFETNLTSVLDQLQSMVKGYELKMEPVAEFGFDYIESQPEEAKMLGCEPDFNAYTRRANPTPNAKMPFRTASGHIHIGWTEEPVDPDNPTHLEACYTLVKALDVFVGVPSVLWEGQNKRKQLYGKAGAFRPKPYGLEYRVPSNRWLYHPILRKLVYNNAMDAVKSCFKDPTPFEEDNWRSSDGVSVQELVNDFDETLKPGEEENKWGRAFVQAISRFNVKTPRDYQ